MGHALGNNYGKFYSMLSKPVLVDCNFVVDSTNGNGLGIRSLKGQGVQNVFMHTSATPGKGPNGILNPNPAVGLAWVQLAYNYTRYYGGASGFVAPSTGSTLAINASALTVGQPYMIASVGHAAAGTVTIAPVADVSGSLASKYFLLFDAYGNTFVVWFRVSGVGSAPSGVSGTLVQIDIVTNDSAATIGAKIVVVLNALLAQTLQAPSAPSGVFSFTASGTTTVTAVNTNTNPYQLPGAPQDGYSPLGTGFAFAFTVNDSNRTDWQGVGVPPGVVPAVGVSFIAKAVGFGSSTGLAIAVGNSGISAIEGVGDANLSLGPVPFRGSPNVGGWILVQFLAATSAGVTTLIPAAPANGSVCGLQFYLEQAAQVGGNQE